MMDTLAGHARIQRKTISQTTGNSTKKSRLSFLMSSNSTTESITESRESVLDATLFRALSPNQAVALLSLSGYSIDDVLELLLVFV